MSVSDQESGDGDYSGKDKMYRRLTAAAEVKLSSLLPLVNIDAENYMLREISWPNSSTQVPPAPEAVADDTSDGDVDMNQQEEETVSDLETIQTDLETIQTDLETIQTNFKKNQDTDDFWGWGTNTNGGGDGVECCARILSFHSLLCSCEMSCCCKCVTLRSIDCHACFYKHCLRYYSNYMCQKENGLPQGTLEYDKLIDHWL